MRLLIWEFGALVILIGVLTAATPPHYGAQGDITTRDQAQLRPDNQSQSPPSRGNRPTAKAH
jgi:hypothetical protein